MDNDNKSCAGRSREKLNSSDRAALIEIKHQLLGSVALVDKQLGVRNTDKADRVRELCELVDISPRNLAGGIILSRAGDITKTELAELLGVSRRTINNWPNVRRVMKNKAK